MTITIRQATIEDFATIQQLNTELFKSDSRHDPELDFSWPAREEGVNYYKKALTDPSYVTFIASDEKNTAVGYVIGTVRNKFSYRSVTTGELENMLVIEGARRQGIGKKLVESLVAYLKRKGCDRLYVSAYAKNAFALAFYESVGFTPLDIGLEMTL